MDGRTKAVKRLDGKLGQLPDVSALHSRARHLSLAGIGLSGTNVDAKRALLGSLGSANVLSRKLDRDDMGAGVVGRVHGLHHSVARVGELHIERLAVGLRHSGGKRVASNRNQVAIRVARLNDKDSRDQSFAAFQARSIRAALISDRRAANASLSVAVAA